MIGAHLANRNLTHLRMSASTMRHFNHDSLRRRFLRQVYNSMRSIQAEDAVFDATVYAFPNARNHACRQIRYERQQNKWSVEFVINNATYHDVQNELDRLCDLVGLYRPIVQMVRHSTVQL